MEVGILGFGLLKSCCHGARPGTAFGLGWLARLRSTIPTSSRFMSSVSARAGISSRWLSSKAIAEATHNPHKRGILHRDLKPANLPIDSNDQPRVTDFGLAKRLQEDSDFSMRGQLPGLPNHMPPKQATSKRGILGRRAGFDRTSSGRLWWRRIGRTKRSWLFPPGLWPEIRPTGSIGGRGPLAQRLEQRTFICVNNWLGGNAIVSSQSR